MLIPHPLLGLRDASEFTYLGDASLLQRPIVTDAPSLGSDSDSDTELDRFHDYLHLRTNPAGEHRELWFHEQGDRSWLIVTRDTRTHEIVACEFAHDPTPPDEACQSCDFAHDATLPDEACRSCEFAHHPAMPDKAGQPDESNGADA